MTRSKRATPNFLNGAPELLILKLLGEREMYGYELVREMEARSGSALAFAEGCVYPVLHGLEARGRLLSRRRSVNGRDRLYYRLTRSGRKRLEALTEEWARVSQGLNRVLEAGHA